MLRKFEKPFDPTPVSEGMHHGPFPPPELDSAPTSARWIMAEADGDPALYQLLMLRDSLRYDMAEQTVSETVFRPNDRRLEFEIAKVIGKKAIPELRQQLRDKN